MRTQAAERFRGIPPQGSGVGFTGVKLLLTSLVLTPLALLAALAGSAGVTLGLLGLGLVLMLVGSSQ